MKKLRLFSFLAITSVCLSWMVSCTHTEITAATKPPSTITDNRIDEASGIAVSAINEDLIWINNDSMGPAELYAVNSNGDYLATMEISGVKNTDWEDLATFEYQGNAYILIADVGDNYARRPDYTLHIIKEPKLHLDSDTSAKLKVSPAWSLTFSYPDGSRDCEAVAVDVQNEKILLLSKREEPPQLFELPLTAKGNEKLTATKLGAIAPLPEPSQARLGLIDLIGYGDMPTAMDISFDGSALVVLTYKTAYLFRKENNEDWLTLLSSTPKDLMMPSLKQAEAAGFDRQGNSVFITTEKLPAPLVRISTNK